jgi:lipopolysaccharide transport system ATP-binding protein
MATAIKVENLSKIYRLGEIGTGTISRDIERFVKTKILKQDDPFLKVGETNDRATKGASDIVYSLKDINFEIEQGDAVGVIGRNGAGKSTLLKILSRVTSPTTGKINIKGRVASLLEVGTGFHPELTGRENIYLNGAILGMRKREIDIKLDEIIDFSGVERYIDTPVKRYSSGMYVRLAFAVAAHLESEILIVDEVLAVGDAEFQKKCLGKMGEVSKGEGRTVLFVSHNMAAVQSLCNKGIMLKNGIINYNAEINDLVQYYASEFIQKNIFFLNKLQNDNDEISLISIQIFQENNRNVFYIEDDTNIIIEFKLKEIQNCVSTSIHLNCMGSKVFCVGTESSALNSGTYQFKYKIPSNLLNTKVYTLDIFLIFNVTEIKVQLNDILSFKMEERTERKEYVGVIDGVIRPIIPFTKPIKI